MIKQKTEKINMQKIFIINGGQALGESSGKLNNTIADWTENFLKECRFDVRVTHVSKGFDAKLEVGNFVWADAIVWHTPIWWFQLPYKLKQYIDEVLHNEGHGKLYKSDGRTRTNPEINYGTGGLLRGKKYMITTSWNAPEGAFTLEGELMNQTSVDDGVLFGFHIAMKFVGLSKLDGFHFYDVVKGLTPERFDTYHNDYLNHLKQIFDPLKK